MITADQMTHGDMVKAAKAEKCGKCGGLLTVAWLNGGYVLRCKDLTHDTITRHDREYEIQIAQIKEARNLDSNSLMVMPEAKMIERVNMARFPQELTVPDKKLLAQVAITYGFDPLMGEVTIYQGRPFVSIDGRYRKAQETGMLDGVETRPATKQEREDWQIPEGDYFYRSEVYVKGASRPFVAWGRVYMAETVGGKGYKPVERNPQRMAEKRAEAQALRKAFHIPLPSAEDIGSPEVEQPRMTVTVEPPANADRETSEIKEPEPPKTEQKPARDPATVKTIAELYRACNQDFKMQPKDVLNELNVKDYTELREAPAEYYTIIANVRKG